MYSIRKIVTALILLCLAVGVKAAPGGLVVQSWRWDQTKNAAIVRMLNTSDKDISAYSLAVTITYKDGTSHASEHATDYLPYMASAKIHNLPEKGTFESRGFRDITLGSSQEITNVSIAVAAVIYSDMTAEVKDLRAFDDIIESRKSQTAAVQQATEVMKKAGSAQAAVQELQRIAKAKSGVQQLTLSEIAERLKYSDLNEEIARTETRANFYGPHLKMTAIQQPAVQQ